MLFRNVNAMAYFTPILTDTLVHQIKTKHDSKIKRQDY